MSDTTTRLHLVARQEIDQQPRFRLLQSGSEVTCVDSRVAAEWVGACTISFVWRVCIGAMFSPL